MTDSLNIDSAAETIKIVSFIKNILEEQGFKNVVIGLSGGIDSAVSLSLLRKAIKPENIFVAHLYYFKSQINSLNSFLKKINIPQKNIYNIPIINAVDQIQKITGLKKTSTDYKIRLGNIMARVRMIILYDLAKKHNCLVCGTENKSELNLGYFTRFGDEASDIEPIQHLYKTQVYQLAEYLNIPKAIINQVPTAGLWDNQTDEEDFGFSYQEADKVLNFYLNNHKSFLKNVFKKFPNAEKIISRINKNSFKHNLPYLIK
jgi:NAD+ synthase